MKHNLTLLLLLVSMLTPLAAQDSDALDDNVLFDSTSSRLEDAMKDSGRRHAIYSYNIANATTPGFKPILLPDDEAEFQRILPDEEQFFGRVVVEHMMTKMSQNSKRQAALYALYRKRLDNYRQVATLGKK